MPHEALLSEVTRLIENGESLVIVIPQDTGFFAIEPERIEGVRRLVGETAALLEKVTTTFEGQESLGQPGSALSPQELADLAYVCRAELLELEDDFTLAVDSGNTWKIASQGDRTLARTVRALIPIEASLRQYLRLEPIRRQWFVLDDALEIRRHFVELWSLIRRRNGDEPFEERLGAVVDYIDRLRQEKVYPHIRIDDRLHIRDLQKRIRKCLEEAPGGASSDGADARETERLWQDTVGFFDLLMHISRREELRDHDRSTVTRVSRQIQDGGGDPAARAQVRESLLPLASQEPELDALLLATEPADVGSYREPLEKLRIALATAARR